MAKHPFSGKTPPDAALVPSIPIDSDQAPAHLDECRRCALYAHATQAVPGGGKKRARIMLVGEQAMEALVQALRTALELSLPSA